MLKIRRGQSLRLYSTADGAVEFPTLCKAFIETEIRHAVARRESLQRIVKGFYDALARIVGNSVFTKIPPKCEFVGLCGGAALDPAFVAAMRHALGSTHQIRVAEAPIYTGAFGAALLAIEYDNGNSKNS